MNERRQAIKALENAGYVFDHDGGNHDIYKHPQKHITIPVPRHKFGKNTLRYILAEIKRGER